MAGVDFNRMHLCSGSETIRSPQASPRSVVFEKKMEGIPTVTTTVVGSSQNVFAANVTSSGFDIILSLDGTGDMNTTFTVHYTAIFLR
tara:strand:+ start:1021 stop:1284 length:264 start_codon:yes stop_codon:yes gene_type:complete